MIFCFVARVNLKHDIEVDWDQVLMIFVCPFQSKTKIEKFFSSSNAIQSRFTRGDVEHTISMSMSKPWGSTYHFVIHPAPLSSQSFERRLEAFEFHCHSSRAFVIDAVEKSSKMAKKKRKEESLVIFVCHIEKIFVSLGDGKIHLQSRTCTHESSWKQKTSTITLLSKKKKREGSKQHTSFKLSTNGSLFIRFSINKWTGKRASKP